MAGQKSSTARGPAALPSPRSRCTAPSGGPHLHLIVPDAPSSPPPAAPGGTLTAGPTAPPRCLAPTNSRPPRAQTHTHERSARSLQAEDECSPLREARRGGRCWGEGSEAGWGRRPPPLTQSAGAGGARRGDLTVPTDRHHGGRGGGHRRGRGPRGRGEAALGSARQGGREHVMALPSLLCCYPVLLAVVGGLASVVAPCTWVSEPHGGSG